MHLYHDRIFSGETLIFSCSSFEKVYCPAWSRSHVQNHSLDQSRTLNSLWTHHHPPPTHPPAENFLQGSRLLLRPLSLSVSVSQPQSLSLSLSLSVSVSQSLSFSLSVSPNQERSINLSILPVSGPGEISHVESN